MSSGLIDLLRELSQGIDGVSFKRMFGGQGIFQNGRMFGLIARDTVYLKSDPETDPQFDVEELEHFTYRISKSGKPMQMGYRRLPERCLDDPEEFRHWAGYGIDAANRAALKSTSKTRIKSL